MHRLPRFDSEVLACCMSSPSLYRFPSNLHLSFSIKTFLFELIISIIHALKMLLKRHDSCLICLNIADSASLQPHSHFFMPLHFCEAFQTLPSSNPSTRSPLIPHLSESPSVRRPLAHRCLILQSPCQYI